MAIYLTGVLTALLISVVGLIFGVMEAFSRSSKNLKKIGLYYNPMRHDYITCRPVWWYIILISFIVSPLLSWIEVIVSLFVFVKSLINRAPVPEKVKEMRFKLSTADLPKEKVKEIVKEMGDFYGFKNLMKEIEEQQNEESVNTEDIDSNVYVIDPGEWYSELRLNKPIKRFTVYGHSPDYDCVYHSVYEYKYDLNKLFIRLIEDNFENAGSPTEYDVKDNVVLESDILKRDKEHKNLFTKVEDKLKSLKTQIEWNEPNSIHWKYFLMYHHRDVINEFEFRKYMRSELVRLELGIQKLTDSITKNAGKIVNENGSYEVRLIDVNDNIAKEKIQDILKEENLSKIGISFYEFQEWDKIKGEINNYLKEE